MSSSRLWVLGTVVLAVGLAALGWLLGIQPQLSHAASSDAERTSVLSANAMHESELALLKKQFASIGELKSQLEQLERAVPTSGEMPAFVNEVNSLAVVNAVSVHQVQVSDAQPYLSSAAAVAPVTKAAATGPSASSTPSSSPSASAAPAAPAAPTAPVLPPAPVAFTSPLVTSSNFIAIPVSVTVRGQYGSVLGFVKAAQSGDRLFLVNGLAIRPVDASKVGPTAEFDGVLSGYVYVLLGLNAKKATPAN
ncbi:MAG: hypothetical protein ACYCZY_02700 [Lacisediminihabitans sp.]